MRRRAAVVIALVLSSGCRRDAGSRARAASPPPPTGARTAPLLSGLAAEARVASPPPERKQAVHTRRDDVVETIHGVKVADPYRWLEDSSSPEVKAWDDEENALTRRYMDALRDRPALVARLRDLLRVGSVGGPAVSRAVAGVRRYFHTKREGDQNQPILYVREGIHGKDRPLVDANALSADGTTALDWYYPSWDGALLAWGSSQSGSEDSTLAVRDVKTGADLADRIPFTRHASVAWLPDRSGFYYSRYPQPGSVPPGDEQYFCKIYFHALGADWKSDPLIYARAQKTDVPQVSISPSGRWLVVNVHLGWDRSEVFVRDRTKGDAAPWVPVAEGVPAIFDADAYDDVLYLRTNDGAPKFRLFAVRYEAPARASWKELVPERGDPLEGAARIGDAIVATYTHEASTRLERFALDGAPRGALPLPGIGSASVGGASDDHDAFVFFHSFVTPPEVTRFSLRGAGEPKGETWDRVGEAFRADDVEVTLRWATSKDGTKIPMFVVAKRGLPRTGATPTILWGYGGFNVNQTPAFSVRALATVERGGVWVSAILRGGAEFGEAWHQAGMLDRKQNVFDDFAACAEALIADKITSPEHLAIMGGSNGGLLVAAAITQRPELFRAAVSLVPLTDMLRYDRFRIGKLWVSEYGDPADPKQFATLYAYSPYHHVRDGVRYPATLFTTAESDSRVDPMHARKMAARMQEAQADPSRPILLKVETKAGHGAGKPISKITESLADELGFAFHETGAMP